MAWVGCAAGNKLADHAISQDNETKEVLSKLEDADLGADGLDGLAQLTGQ